MSRGERDCYPGRRETLTRTEEGTRPFERWITVPKPRILEAGIRPGFLPNLRRNPRGIRRSGGGYETHGPTGAVVRRGSGRARHRCPSHLMFWSGTTERRANDERDGRHRGARRPRKGGRAAAGGATAGLRTVRQSDAASAVQTGGALRGDRRIPLFPGRPQADRPGIPHGQPVPAPEHRHRPPRDHLPGRSRQGRGRPQSRRRHARRGLDLLRQRRHRRRRLDRPLGAGSRRDAAHPEGRLSDAARQSTDHAGALQPARHRGQVRRYGSVRDPAAAHRRQGRPQTPGDRPAGGTDRAPLHGRGVRPAV